MRTSVGYGFGVVAVLLAAFPGPSRAKMLATGGVKAGVFLPNSDEKGLKNFGTGWAASLEGKVGVYPMVDVGLQVGYLSTSLSQQQTLTVPTQTGYGTATVNAKATFTDIPIEINLFFAPPIPVVSLYVGAGASYHMAQDQADYGSGSNSESGSGTGYQAKVGVGYGLPVGSLGLDAEYSASGIKFSNATDNVNGGGITVSLSYQVGF